MTLLRVIYNSASSGWIHPSFPFIVGSFLWLSTLLTVGAGELRIQRMFGPEVKTGPYKHPARIEALASGDLYAVYYGGEGEYATDTGVFGARLKKGTRQW